MSESMISANVSSVNGGGIAVADHTGVKIDRTTISGNSAGQAGGGLFSADSLIAPTPSDTLTLSGVQLLNNTASIGAGLRNGNNRLLQLNCWVECSRIAGNMATLSGGGLFNDAGYLQLSRTTIDGNRAGQTGGGLHSYGGSSQTNIREITLSGNYASSEGGGIFLAGAPADIVQSTISGNSAGDEGGGLYLEEVPLSVGQVRLRHTTITDNTAARGGGLRQYRTTAVLLNSILAGNHAIGDGGFASTDLVNVLSPDSAYSLIGVVGDPAQTGGGIAMQYGTVDQPLDARLGPLGSHGGPTQTHDLQADSPAVDVGDPNFMPGTFTPPLDRDQNVFPRVVDGDSNGTQRIDLGATEFSFPSSDLVVSLYDDENDGDISPNDLSLREAVLLANSIPGPKTIYLPAGHYTLSLPTAPESFDANFGDLDIRESVTIRGDGPERTIVDAQGRYGVFAIAAATSPAEIFVELRGLTIQGGNANIAGGGVMAVGVGANVLIANCVLRANHAKRFGGGLGVNNYAVAVVVNSTIEGNTTDEHGGGILNEYYTSLTLINSTVSGNTAKLDGGAVRNYGFAQLALISSTVAYNTTMSGKFGGITDGQEPGQVRFAGEITLKNSILANNGPYDLYGNLDASSEYSLIGVGDRIATGPGDGENGNRIGTLDQPIDALLGPLEYNAGPTRTHALLPGSPAIDAGNPEFNPNSFTPPLNTDQNGFPRVVDGNADGTPRIDLGASEFAPGFLFGTLFADLNGDGQIGVLDVGILNQNFGATDALYAQGDLNGDRQVDRFDAAILAAKIGRAAATPTALAATAPAAVVVQAAPARRVAPRQSADVALAARRKILPPRAVDRALAVDSQADIVGPSSRTSTIRARRGIERPPKSLL